MNKLAVNKKLEGLQTARQRELDKSKEQKRKLDKIDAFIKDFYMHPYSNEVIEIKNTIIGILNE